MSWSFQRWPHFSLFIHISTEPNASDSSPSKGVNPPYASKCNSFAVTRGSRLYPCNALSGGAQQEYATPPTLPAYISAAQSLDSSRSPLRLGSGTWKMALRAFPFFFKPLFKLSMLPCGVVSRWFFSLFCFYFVFF